MEDSMRWLLGNTFFGSRIKCLRVFSQQLLTPACTTITRAPRQRSTCRSQCTTSFSDSQSRPLSFRWDINTTTTATTPPASCGLWSGTSELYRAQRSRFTGRNRVAEQEVGCSGHDTAFCHLPGRLVSRLCTRSSWFFFSSSERGLDDVGVVNCVECVLQSKDSTTRCDWRRMMGDWRHHCCGCLLNRGSLVWRWKLLFVGRSLWGFVKCGSFAFGSPCLVGIGIGIGIGAAFRPRR